MEQKKWYALYTRSRFEQKVKSRLEEQGVEVFLPMMTDYRKWTDRVKKVMVPLFSSYIFVYTHPENYNHYQMILNTPGAVRLVSFEGRPVAIPQSQVDSLRQLSDLGYELQPREKALPPGTHVEVTQGSFKGIKGSVVSTGNRQLLIIRIDVLDKDVVVTLPAGQVRRV